MGATSLDCPSVTLGQLKRFMYDQLRIFVIDMFVQLIASVWNLNSLLFENDFTWWSHEYIVAMELNRY